MKPIVRLLMQSAEFTASPSLPTELSFSDSKFYESLSNVPAAATTTTMAMSEHNDSLVPQLVSIRGGAGAIDLDLERVSLRLDGLESYSVIASILLWAVLHVYQSCERKSKCARGVERIAQYVHATSSTLSILFGMYVITVFSLFSLYAKMALGRGADDVYLDLMQKTGAVRYMGFKAFMWSLITFEIALVANFFLSFKGKARWIFSTACAAGTWICYGEWQTIIACASEYIFKR